MPSESFYPHHAHKVMGWRMTDCMLLSYWRISAASVKRFNDVRRFLRGGKEMLHGVLDWRAYGLGYVQSVERQHVILKQLSYAAQTRLTASSLKSACQL